MRTACIVIAAYLACVVLGAVWRLVPIAFLRDGVPDIGALTAAYLGLTARRDVAPAVGGSVVLGYLCDAISGTAAGLMALTLGLTSLVTRSVQQRLLVRGVLMTVAFSGFVAVVARVFSWFVRTLYGMPRPGLLIEVRHLALIALSTAIVGPFVWRGFRRIDATFARTHRERDAALEGLAP